MIPTNPSRPAVSLVSAAIAAAVFAAAGPLPAQTPNRTIPPAVAVVDDDGGAEGILLRYAEAWRGRQEMAIPDTIRLGFVIRGEDGGEFSAVVPPDGPATLARGPAGDGAIVFETDIETLRKLDAGQWNVLTAMGQARASDPTPVVPRFPPGFRWTPENRALYIPFLFHFWNREWPERIRFGEGTTRSVHGAEGTVLYYDSGLRTAWYQLKEGMHVNADPADQTNPFRSLFIVTRGVARARLDGTERTIREGEAFLVPPGMTHEFWAEPGDYAEVVLIMFGAGA